MSTEDIITIFVFGVIALTLLFVFSKHFYFIAFDEEVAQTSGIKINFLKVINSIKINCDAASHQSGDRAILRPRHAG